MKYEWEEIEIRASPLVEASEFTWSQGPTLVVDAISDCAYELNPDGTVSSWHSPITSDDLP